MSKTDRDLLIEEIQILEEIQRRKEMSRIEFFKPYEWQKEFFQAGLRNKQRFLLAANRVGKALRNGTNVATPGGYVPIESLRVGDIVIAGDGSQTKVTGVYPQGIKQLYRITFDVGESIDCCGEHLWKYQHPRARYPYRQSHGKKEDNPFFGEWRVDNTATILKSVGEKPISRMRVVVPTSQPWQMKRAELPIGPYLLGSLIGDGCFTAPSGVGFSCADLETVEYIRGILPHKYCLSKCKGDNYDYRIVNKTGMNGDQVNEILDSLRLLDLHGKKSEFKFIPKAYLAGDPADRLELLRGLMDADGYISQTGAMEFSTVSEQLADDVIFVVNSLGGKASKSLRQTKYTYNGKKKNGQPSFRVRIRLNICPFRLSRKADRWNPRKNTSNRVIHKIEKIDSDYATCISVDHPDKLFVTDHGVVTHNTFGAAAEFAFHVTGNYPDWWTGYKFKVPIRTWALGVTGDQIRDVIQKELCGDILDGPDFGKGAIPGDLIKEDSIIRSPQTRGLIKDFKVKHSSGGYSSIGFRAYSQGQKVLMGTAMDYIWIDEEPEDQEIYPQCVVRTATGNQGQGGQVVITATPELGMTPLVCQFLEDLQPGQYLKNVTWDDAPHLTKETKEQLLAAIPDYQRDMRAKGIPVLGSGVIFPIKDEDITCDPFDCPDHWHVINGVDFGWDHPQAHIQLWHDTEHDISYIARAWRKSERDANQAWTATKAWADQVPVAWPHDGLQHEKGGGKQLVGDYRDAGFDMLRRHATWPDTFDTKSHGGNNMSVEAGLWHILQDMREGKFKIFSNLNEVFEEKRLYHRDDKGKVVKERDDLISAIRYAYMMRRHAMAWGDIKRLRDRGGIEMSGHIESNYDPFE